MNIGIFTELYPPHIGGQEVRYAELAAALLALGHSVDVFCVRHDAGVPEVETASGVAVFRYPLAENYQRPTFKALRRAVFPLLRYSLWARQHARPEKYGLMIFNQWPLAHIALARSAARPCMVVDWCEVREGWLYRAFMRYLPRMAARNLAVSEAVAQVVSLKSGCPVEYLPSGIWCANYSQRPRGQRSGLLYVGRVTEHKNLELLIESFERLKHRGYGGGLTIAGSGPGLESLRARAASSRFAGQIHLPGYVDEAAKCRLLAEAEALVITSRREGFPRVVAEAMASGLPVATVDFVENGTRTIVSQYSIGVVAEGNPEALAVAIRRLLDDWLSYSESGLRHSRTLDWPLLVQRLLHPQQS